MPSPSLIQSYTPASSNIHLSGSKQSVNIDKEYFADKYSIGGHLTLTKGETITPEQSNLLERLFDFICDWVQDKLYGTDILGFKSQFEKLLNPELEGDEFFQAFNTLTGMIRESDRNKVFYINDDMSMTPQEMLEVDATIAYKFAYTDGNSITFLRSPTTDMKEEASAEIKSAAQDQRDRLEQRKLAQRSALMQNPIYQLAQKNSAQIERLKN